MQIRIKSTGAVMYESEFRAYTKANGGPSWDTTTTEVLEALGADVVFEGGPTLNEAVARGFRALALLKSPEPLAPDRLFRIADELDP